jgi:hypothetical protein
MSWTQEFVHAVEQQLGMSAQTSGTQYPFAPDVVVHPEPSEPPASGPPVQSTSCAHAAEAAWRTVSVPSDWSAPLQATTAQEKAMAHAPAPPIQRECMIMMGVAFPP